MLYQLILTDPGASRLGGSEDFGIGIFATKAEAEATAHSYLRHVAGFCDYPCTYRIVEKEVKGTVPGETFDRVWIIQGWNENAEMDETDVVESDCLSTQEAADRELDAMRRLYVRAEWTIREWVLGRRAWGEGFVRYDTD